MSHGYKEMISMQIKRLTLVMLGVVSLSMFAFAATAEAATLSTVTAGPGFTVTATANFADDGSGKCQVNPRANKQSCNVSLTAQADGPGPYRYDWWDDKPGSRPPSYESQQNVGYGYTDAGTYRPTVRVTNTSTGQSVDASPGAIQVYVVPPPPVELFVGDVSSAYLRIGARTLITAQSQRSPLRVYWRSSTATGKAYSTECVVTFVRCFRVLAAPAGPLLIVATAGAAPSDVTSRTVQYVGPPVGSFKARYRAKKSGSRCKVTASVTGAAGTKYRYRPTINGKKGKSRRGTPSYEPIKTLGKFTKTVSRGTTLVIRHRLTVGSKAYGPKPTKKRVRC